MAESPRTLGAAIESISLRFREAELTFGHGTDNAWDEAVALVLAVTGAPDDRAALDRPLAAADWASIDRLAERRCRERSPLAYLLGHCRYVGLEFEVQPGLVVPRSPLGPMLLDHAEDWLARAPRRIADLCCGTGCLGIVAACLFPDAELTLVDLDPLACTVAGRNLARHELNQRATVVQADVLTWAEQAGRFDLILCNPPYVDATTMATLPPEFLKEPVHGLAAGTDGLAVILPLLEFMDRLLKPQGVLLGEVGRSGPTLARLPQAQSLTWLADDAEGVFLLRRE